VNGYRPAPRVYGYGPVYGIGPGPAYGYAPVYGYGPGAYLNYGPAPRGRPNDAMGIYAPRNDEQISTPKKLFRAIERQDGG
jgi:hypothetical protein